VYDRHSAGNWLALPVCHSAEFAPQIANKACVYPSTGSPADCIWSNEIRHSSFAYEVYLPVVLK
jgi:hypothetical protein